MLKSSSKLGSLEDDIFTLMIIHQAIFLAYTHVNNLKNIRDELQHYIDNSSDSNNIFIDTSSDLYIVTTTHRPDNRKSKLTMSKSLISSRSSWKSYLPPGISLNKADIAHAVKTLFRLSAEINFRIHCSGNLALGNEGRLYFSGRKNIPIYANGKTFTSVKYINGIKKLFGRLVMLGTTASASSDTDDVLMFAIVQHYKYYYQCVENRPNRVYKDLLNKNTLVNGVHHPKTFPLVHLGASNSFHCVEISNICHPVNIVQRLTNIVPAPGDTTKQFHLCRHM